MSSGWTRTRDFFNLALVITAAVFVVQLITISRENQELRSDLAEVNHIKYNLLNIEEWSVQIKGILDKKIEEFEITEENQQRLESRVEKILYDLIDEVELLMKRRTAGQFSRIKRWVAGLAIDVDQLRDSVPSFASQILVELEDPGTKQAIRVFMSEKLDQYIASTRSMVDLGKLDELMEAYDVDSRKETNELISGRLSENMDQLELYQLLVLAVMLVVFLLSAFAGGTTMHFYQVLILVFAAVVLLIGGVMMPMIQLEAKIDLIRFELLGEQMTFRDNILYYQSKSILDMVVILLKDGSARMIMVGFLIFMFSLIFPTLKLVSTVAYTGGNGKMRQSRLIRFFTLKSSKWSMADVFVVAIFMAYIGFNGIVDNQMEELAEGAKPVETFTTNGTRLLPGFFMFLSFVIYGMGLSWLIDKKYPA